MIVLSSMVPGDLILIAGHLHEDPASQIWDQRLVVGEPGNRADGLRPEPKADAHRASRKRILSEAPRQLDRADDTRAVIIRLHRMTGMRLHKELAGFGIRSARRVNDRGRNFESLPG